MTSHRSRRRRNVSTATNDTELPKIEASLDRTTRKLHIFKNTLRVAWAKGHAQGRFDFLYKFACKHKNSFCILLSQIEKFKGPVEAKAKLRQAIREYLEATSEYNDTITELKTRMTRSTIYSWTTRKPGTGTRRGRIARHWKISRSMRSQTLSHPMSPSRTGKHIELPGRVR